VRVSRFTKHCTENPEPGAHAAALYDFSASPLVGAQALNGCSFDKMKK